MKKFAARALYVCVFACVFAGCSNEEEGTEPVVPSVKIESAAADGNTLTFTITPVDATECAYVCYAEGEAKQDAAAILASGKAADASKPSEVTVTDLEYNAKYCIAAAVKSTTGDVAMAETTLSTGAEPAKDLGAPANTYVVSEAGKYVFSTKHVSGTEIEGIVSADWLWATKNAVDETEQKIISDVSYADGKISFTATGARGNVTIIALDAGKKVVWEWLIWCSEQPSEMKYSSGAVFQDRALGAMGSKREDGEKAQTLIVYQWGRPTPLVSGYEDEHGDEELFNEARKWTIMNPEYFYGWSLEKREVTPENAVAAPTTMFADQATCDWFMGRNNLRENMLQWTAAKADNDPCPAGYRLPTPEDWGNFASELNRETAETDGGFTYTFEGKTAWFPLGVDRQFDTGEAGKGFAHLFYWNGVYMFHDPMGFVANGWATEEQVIAANMGGYYGSRVSVQFDATTISPLTNASGNWSFAHPVRCVKVQ